MGNPRLCIANITFSVYIALCRAQTRHTQAGGDGDEQLRLSGRAPTAVRQRDQFARMRTVRWKFRLRRSRTSTQEMFWAAKTFADVLNAISKDAAMAVIKSIYQNVTHDIALQAD
jgi:hypothetical protein